VSFARVNFEFEGLLELGLINFALVESHPYVTVRNRLIQFSREIRLGIESHLLLRLTWVELF